MGDFNKNKYKRDFIIYQRRKGLTKITDLHPKFMAMTYPLIHPYGEDGYRVGTPLRDGYSIGLKR